MLIVLTMTGMVISYPWASNLVYTLTGSPRPVAAGRGGGPGGPGVEGQRGRGGRGAAARGPNVKVAIAANPRRRGGESGSSRRDAPRRSRQTPVALASLESLVARAEQQVADLANDDHPATAAPRRTGVLLDVRS